MSTRIYIKTQFEAQHRWKDAPVPVAFLRNYHRHIFYVKVSFSVTHGDREIEYFLFKRQLDQYIAETFAGQQFDLSCEQIAEHLLIHFRALEVEVSEDNENGSIVQRSGQAVLQKGRCFVGTELEGPAQGARVLFVPGSTSTEAFLAAVQQARTQDPFIGRIYYGAGNERNGNGATLETVLDYAHTNKLIVDVECSEADRAVSVLRFAAIKKRTACLGYVIALCSMTELERQILDRSLTEEEGRKKLMQKQIVDDTITWTEPVPGGDSWQTWLYHPGFDQDRYI